MIRKDADEMAEGIIISFELIKQLKEAKSIDPGLERKYMLELRDYVPQEPKPRSFII